MKSVVARAGLLVMASLVCACTEIPAQPFVADNSANVNGNTLVSDPTVGVAHQPCPTQRPLENSLCGFSGPDKFGLCEYPVTDGSAPSVDPRCNARMRCNESVWTTVIEPGCNALSACPATRAAVPEGAPCELPAGASVELLCGYPEGACGCTTGPGAGNTHARKWVCVLPPAVECGRARPLIGQRCVQASPCEYGTCEFANGMRMICDHDVWAVGESQCL